MPVARFVRHGKRPYGFCAKVAATATLGLCFVVLWSTLSSPSTSISSQRSTFADISVPDPAKHAPLVVEPHHSTDHKSKEGGSSSGAKKREASDSRGGAPPSSRQKKAGGDGLHQSSADKVGHNAQEVVVVAAGDLRRSEEGTEDEDADQEEGNDSGGDEASSDQFSQTDLGRGGDGRDAATKLVLADDDEFSGARRGNGKADTNNQRKKVTRGGPLFDPGAHYTWSLCKIRTSHNYIPCLDIESPTAKLQRYRHHERSCPKTPPMCLVPLPQGYASPVRWPHSKSRVLYKNVAHPKLASFIKARTWMNRTGEYLTFSQAHSALKGGGPHYVDSLEEMVPDIEWGKNIRLVLDIGCTDASFSAALLEKAVLTLSLGLKDDEADLAQVALERGFPALIGIMGTRRLPFPSGVFDAIHCGGCRIPWHFNGGKFLLEMNRILRPGGYFILSTEHDNIEVEEAMSKLTASICWNILAHRTEEISEVGVKIYQKPSSNDIYQWRRKKMPQLCKEDENPDAAWYSPMLTCLHTVPSAVEERGSEWPEDWPQRLDNLPDWLRNREILVNDTGNWRAIVNNSYLYGLGIDWSNVRNVMDMKAMYGGFAAALAVHKVWVMNVVSVHAPNTLSVIYERGLLGSYHDWCESFSTYPRTYDLLHADHLFSRLKNRCKQPVGIVVEMDRILRPGGWVIIRDKVVILDPLEEILRSLHWEIQMTYAKDKEGVICAKKTAWRP